MVSLERVKYGKHIFYIYLHELQLSKIKLRGKCDNKTISWYPDIMSNRIIKLLPSYSLRDLVKPWEWGKIINTSKIYCAVNSPNNEYE